MKIVVLDGYTLNPGDLDWGGLEALGECEVHDRTPAEWTVPRARGAGVVLTNKTLLDRSVLEQLPELRYVGVLATGYNVVDLPAASERGVVVTNVPAYSTESVAQMTFAHLLNLAQRVAHHDATVRAGRWTASEDFCYWETPLIELCNRTLGIVGLGTIGRAVARIARAFGMGVLACNRSAPRQIPDGVTMVDTLDELLPAVDVLSLHCPLTDDNRAMINAERLERMKSSALLINTARGALIDEQALADALNCGVIAGAGLDVLSEEPPAGNSPLIGATNCFITPHISWATREARERLMATAVDNVAAFLRGEPKNQVN